jgi:hypothetical protein
MLEKMSNQFSTYTERPDTGSTIRQPSVALLCVDSYDQFINANRDLVTQTRLDFATQYRSLIYKKQSLVTGKINRVALTEVNFNWNIPNVNDFNNVFNIAFGIPWNAVPSTTWNATTTYVINDLVDYKGNVYIALAGSTGARPDLSPGSWQLCLNESVSVPIPNGFYNLTDLAAAVESELNTALLVAGMFQVVITVLPTLHFNILVTTNVAFTAVTPAVVINPTLGGSIVGVVTAGKSFVPNMWVTVVGANNANFIARIAAYNAGTGAITVDKIHNIDGDFTPNQVYDVNVMATPTVYKNELGVMMGFDGPNAYNQALIEGPVELQGNFALMSYTPYIDICSTRLTKNQHVYDNSSSITSPIRSVLTRIYLTPDGITTRTDEDQIIGVTPFTIHKEFSFPKQIAWEPTEGIDSIDIEVLDSKGRVLYTEPLYINSNNDIVTGTSAQFQFTLQVSEN